MTYTRKRFDNDYKEHKYTQELGNLWKVLATHLALSIQRAHQAQSNNKGNTVLIFDRHDQDQNDYAKIIVRPPEWADTYYSRDKKQKQLDQIIDVPHFVDSEHVGMIQVADCISYFLRRHLELTHGVGKERYDGEAEITKKWAGAITDRCHSMSSMYPKKGRCEVAEYFYQLAPDGIK